MNPRHLWAAPKIRNGDQMTIWQLLEDIKREYNPRMPQARIQRERRRETMAQARRAAALATSSRNTPQKNKRGRHKVPSKRGSKLSLGMHRDLLGHQNSAVQQGPFGLLDPAETVDMNAGTHNRGSRYQSPHPRMSVNNNNGNETNGASKDSNNEKSLTSSDYAMMEKIKTSLGHVVLQDTNIIHSSIGSNINTNKKKINSNKGGNKMTKLNYIDANFTINPKIAYIIYTSGHGRGGHFYSLKAIRDELPINSFINLPV